MSYSVNDYPYNDVLYLTTRINGTNWQGTGAIIGPHTILTASHMLWQSDSQQTASTIQAIEGYTGPGTGTTLNLGQWVTHYYQIDNSGDRIATSQVASDFAIIDVTADLSRYGSFGISTNYGTGTVHLTGYPANLNGASTNGVQFDQTGTISVDSSYSGVLDYGSITSVPGYSGGPIWYNAGTSSNVVPMIVGVASTTGNAVRLTPQDLQQIQAWQQQDSSALHWGSTSTTSQAHLDIARLYSAALDREPDNAGLQGWYSLYDNQVSAAAQAQGVYVSLAETTIPANGLSIAGGFTHSPEFMSRYGNLDDTGYVTQLYRNVLHRAPDQAGVNGWLQLMHNGDGSGIHFTRDMVLVGIAESPENIAKTAGDPLFHA